MTSPKVLVTGADGFIGSELCRQLSGAGYSPVRFSSPRAQTPPSPLTADSSPTPVYRGDIRDRSQLVAALDDVQIVFHLAGIAHVDGTEPALLKAVNVDGTVNVATAAAQAGIAKIVYFSSSLAAAAEQKLPEKTAYGCSKYEAEQRLLAISRENGLDAVVLRPVNVYGPAMKGNLAALIRLVERGLLPPLPDLATKFSLVGLRDICRAAILAAQCGLSGPRTYTVTDGVTYRWTTVEAAIYRALGRNVPRWHSPRAFYWLAATGAGILNRTGLVKTSLGSRSYRNLVTDNLFSNRQIADELGFVPQQTFYTALPELVNVK